MRVEPHLKQAWADASREHRAGKFYLYPNLPQQVLDQISERVLIVARRLGPEHIEIFGWSMDFEPIRPGDVVPHYRWMYDTETFAVECVKESKDDDIGGVAQQAERVAHNHEAAGSTPAPATETTTDPAGADHGLRQEDPARIEA